MQLDVCRPRCWRTFRTLVRAKNIGCTKKDGYSTAPLWTAVAGGRLGRATLRGPLRRAGRRLRAPGHGRAELAT